MRRRTALTLAASTLSTGCIGTATRAISNGNNTMSTEKHVEITHQNQPIDSVPVALSAVATRETITTNRPARLRFTFENVGPNARTFSFGANPPFTPKLSRTRNPGLMLLPPDTDYEPVSEGCWQPAIPEATEYLVPSVLNRVSLDAGESIATELDVWGSHRNDDDTCVPTGEYRFEETYDEFTWRFTVTVSAGT